MLFAGKSLPKKIPKGLLFSGIIPRPHSYSKKTIPLGTVPQIAPSVSCKATDFVVYWCYLSWEAK